jgi:glutathione synthase/RimK-type ligase-like ATP-grasp enzyme
MKIAIHHTKGSFSDRWIAYCEKQHISYKIVDCYKNDIIQQVDDCTALMWHFHHAHPKDTLFAKQLLYAVAAMGKKIFPDFNTSWHFDDKVGQKYLLEAAGAPLVPSYVFYEKREALEWIHNSSFPKVFKLRSGASSANVSLAKSKKEAVALVNKAFGEGFTQYNGWTNFKERIRKFRKGNTTFFDVCKGFIRIFYTTEFSKVAGREKGYIYFQEFIANNDSDIRVIVVDEKAFAIKRMVRENDFRASGGGTILYHKELFDIETIKTALAITKKLNAQCLAFDFVYKDGQPLIVEISYGYANEAYDPVQGYWDKDLNWHEGQLISQEWMVDLMLK